jgi:peptidoglycan/xylan/chitin deacetylase (PgdA/CDA1 family)
MRRKLIYWTASIVYAAITGVSAAESLPNGVPAIPVGATAEQIKQAAALVRAGRTLTPKVWKNGARVAVCVVFDVDNEFHFATGNAGPGALSVGEYGATTGLPRILALLDRQQVPASFFVPAGAAILHPEMIPEILKSGRHEIGVHGWVHEYIPALANAEEEERVLTQSIDYLTKATGKRPVGYKAPGVEFGPHTIELLLRAGFLYDGSMMAMDQPYELLSNGAPTGLLELPGSWVVDDYVYFGIGPNSPIAALPDPQAVFRIFRSEFDVAYRERTLFVLSMHPAVTGYRSRTVELEKLIVYMKSKPDVWFATMEEIARYIKANK